MEKKNKCDTNVNPKLKLVLLSSRSTKGRCLLSLVASPSPKTTQTLALHTLYSDNESPSDPLAVSLVLPANPRRDCADDYPAVVCPTFARCWLSD